MYLGYSNLNEFGKNQIRKELAKLKTDPITLQEVL
jgi:hypothetical protein